MKNFRHVQVIFICLTALFLAPKTFAWDQQDKITEIKTIHGNKTVIRFEKASWQGCSTDTNIRPYFIISDGSPVSDQRKQMLAIALVALSTGKNVWIVTGGSAGDTPACDSTGFEWLYQLSIFP